ncbi:MAG: aconitase X catalytic domain-containing protein [Clostridiales Family XIII bacterium]|nr:aconitase X catalytic domain-containing protein [Clostridiales Family XIII bacterium]
MRLTDEEKKLLDGGEGYLAQRCMRFLVDYGDAAGAECLVDIDGTVDLHPGVNPCWVPDYRLSQDEIEDAAKRGYRFKTVTFTNKPVPGFIIDGCEGCLTYPSSDPAYRDRRMSQIRPLIEMGAIPTFSCDYYLSGTFWPTAGQHCSWGESSAIPWVNAVLGARANFDGCFQAAFIGKIPKYDLHLDENRVATVKVTMDGELKNDIDYELFGWAASEQLEMRVPALLNVGRPTVSRLVKLNTGLTSGGQVRMYHIPGVTPEASSVEAAFRGNKPSEEIVISREDLRRVYDLVNCASDKDVDFVYLGCPHYNIAEVQNAARLLNGKKLRAELWIMTGPVVYYLAERMGLRRIIERAGGKLMSGTCVGELNGELLPYRVMATDSAKQNYYVTGHLHPREIQIWYGTAEECIDAAVTGQWRGEWKR